MWTALLGSETLDLRKFTAADRIELWSDRSAPLQCRGCKGGVLTRRLTQDETDPFIVFAHQAGEAEKCHALGYHCDESPAHDMLKHRLALAAESAGWSAEVEVPGDGCRADVVATSRNGRCRVLEAQISPLGTEDAGRRTGLYEREFGPVLWTHTRPRPWSHRYESMRVDDDTQEMVIGGVMLRTGGDAPAAPVAEMVPKMLDGRLTWIYFEGEDKGAWIDTSAGGAQRRTGRRRGGVSYRGEYVRECARTPEEESDFEALTELHEAWVDWHGRSSDPATANRMVDAVKAAGPILGLGFMELYGALADGLRSGVNHGAVIDRLRVIARATSGEESA